MWQVYNAPTVPDLDERADADLLWRAACFNHRCDVFIQCQIFSGTVGSSGNQGRSAGDTMYPASCAADDFLCCHKSLESRLHDERRRSRRLERLLIGGLLVATFAGVAAGRQNR